MLQGRHTGLPRPPTPTYILDTISKMARPVSRVQTRSMQTSPPGLLGLATGGDIPLRVAARNLNQVTTASKEDRAPATGEVLARIETAGAAEVDAAVQAARAASTEWKAMGAGARADHVHELARLVEENLESLALLDARDTGSPLRSMRADVRKGARALHLYAGLGLEIQGRTIPASATGLHLTLPEPWGVVGAITAYNHPLMFACLRSGPALVAGNALILKPAEQTPLSSIAFASLAEEVLPPGVLTVLPGGPAAGSSLVQHSQVPRITFTGSVPTGEHVQRAAVAGGQFKTLTLELGGKNPMLVFPDADPGEAAEAAVRGMNFTRVQGQSCGSTSRLLVHEDIHDDVVQRVLQLVSAIRLGLPEDEDADMGSLISPEHRDRVLGLISKGRDEGAVLLCGGGPPEGREELKGGAYLEPTVVDSVRAGSVLAGEEVFGPVLSIMTWRDEDEAIRLANDTEYGLTASIWTRDIDRALRVAGAVEAGYIWINDVETRYPGVPFGGWKRSGIGFEQGLSHELLTYTRSKSLNIRVNG
jgi:betaine-aldehyde dehydrogenase